MRNLLRLHDKSFYQTLRAIAIPIAMQNLINFGVNMMDTVMLGLVGEVQLSAASLANQMSFMFMILSTGVASGSAVIAAQYWGKKDYEKVRSTVSLMYRFVMCLGLLFFLLSQIFPEQIIRIFITDDLEVIAEATAYLKIVGWSYLVSGITNSSIGVFRSIGTVKISVVVYSISLVTNTILNYALIFGKFGMPALGIQGAAIATVIARCIECSIIIYYTLKVEKRLQFKLSYLGKTDKELLPLFVTFALPVLFNEMLWTSGNAMVSVVIGRMGREFVAANSICSVLFQLAGIAMFGIGASASTITGHTIGSGDYELAKERAKTFTVIATIVGSLGGLAVFLVRGPVIGIYNISPLAVEYAYGITAVSSCIIVFQAVAIILMMGVLRGGGDTRFVTVLDVSIMWVFALPLGAYAGLVLGLPVPIVYLCLKCDEIFKSILAVIRVHSGKWVRDITR